MLPRQLALDKGVDREVGIRIREAPDAVSRTMELKCDSKRMGDDNAQALCASLAAHAPGLTSLDLSGNELTAVPPAVCDIVSLQTLDLSDNATAELSPESLHIRQLREIDPPCQPALDQAPPNGKAKGME